jgi:hypothetical protein
VKQLKTEIKWKINVKWSTLHSYHSYVRGVSTGYGLDSRGITVLLIDSIIYRHALGVKLYFYNLPSIINSLMIISSTGLVFSAVDVILHSGVNGCFPAGR